MSNLPSVYEYLEYREFLRDFYNFKKSDNSNYSYKVFANQAKLNSPNYLKLVIDGDRRVTDRNIMQFLRGLGLKGTCANFFKKLVQFNECKDIEDKRNLLDKVLKLKTKGLVKAYRLDEDKLEIMRHWYYWAVREMVNLNDFVYEATWISKRLRYRITTEEAQNGIDLLLRLGYLREENEVLVQSEPLITTSDGVVNALLKDLNKQFIDLGVKSIIFDDIKDRENSGLTIALTKDQLPEFKKMIIEFRKDLNKMYTNEENISDDVYQFEMIFFPLTRSVG